MDMFEEAKTLAGMLNMCALTQVEIAKKIGVSQSYVSNKLRLLNFSEDIRKSIIDARLTERHARVLLKIKDENLLKSAIEKISAMKLGVAASEALIESILLDAMPKKILDASIYDKINKFEEIIEESIKNLKSSGINVRQTVDFSKSKKYITICIGDISWNT